MNTLQRFAFSSFENLLPVTNLQALTIYASAIEISWSFLDHLLIDHYEIYVNGNLNNKSKNLQSFALQLNPSTSYSITVRGVYIADGSYTGFSSQIIESTAATENFSYGNITGYWKLDDNLLDSVGLNNGYGNNFSFEDALVNRGVLFNGVNSRVVLGRDADTLDLNGNSTVSFAMKGYDTSYKQTTFEIGNIRPDIEWGSLAIFNLNRSFWFYCGVAEGGSAEDIYKGNTHPQNNINYVVTLVRNYDLGTIKIYLNNSLICNGMTSRPSPVSIKNNDLLNIGYTTGSVGGRGGYFSGNISAFCTMNKAIDSTEVAELVSSFTLGNHII